MNLDDWKKLTHDEKVDLFVVVRGRDDSWNVCFQPNDYFKVVPLGCLRDLINTMRSPEDGCRIYISSYEMWKSIKKKMEEKLVHINEKIENYDNFIDEIYPIMKDAWLKHVRDVNANDSNN